MANYHRLKHKINYLDVLGILKTDCVLNGDITLENEINEAIKKIKAQ